MRYREKNAVCLCNYCGNWLVFEQMRTGTFLSCPHCLMETVLHAPGQKRPDAPDASAFYFRRIEWHRNAMGYRSIVGVMLNHWRSEFRWVRVQFALYNGGDQVIGSTSDVVTDLVVDSPWTFHAPVCEPLVTRASLPIISTEYGSIILGEGVGETFGGYRAEVNQPAPVTSPPLSPYGEPSRGKARSHEVVLEKVAPVHWSQRTPSKKTEVPAGV